MCVLPAGQAFNVASVAGDFRASAHSLRCLRMLLQEDKEAMIAGVRAVNTSRADLGIVVDTDVDRSAVVAGNGTPINSNRYIALMSYIALRSAQITYSHLSLACYRIHRKLLLVACRGAFSLCKLLFGCVTSRPHNRICRMHIWHDVGNSDGLVCLQKVPRDDHSDRLCD